jgi:hypothetical protein
VTSISDISALEQCRDQMRAHVADLFKAQVTVNAELATFKAGLAAIEELIEFKRLETEAHEHWTC